MTAQNSFKIREATSDDTSALAALHVTTFNETHGSFNAPTFETRKWQWQKAFQDKDDSWFCFVMEKEDAGLIGFAKGQLYNHINYTEFQGELNKIYLLRKYHKLGLGRRLVCKVANEFIQRGINSMLLFGDANNPSNNFMNKCAVKNCSQKMASSMAVTAGWIYKNLSCIVKMLNHYSLIIKTT